MKYYFLLAIIFAVACNRQDTQKPKQTPTLTAFYAVYGLQETTPESVALSGKIYAQVKDRLDMKNVQALKSGNAMIYIIAMKEKGKFYAARISHGAIQNEVLYSSKMKDDKNGTIGILKDGDAISIEFRDGQKIIKEMSHKEYEATFAKVDTMDQFCQGNPAVPFGTCFRRESDEFCDSFFSCLALATNPQVSLIIALACSCNGCTC